MGGTLARPLSREAEAEAAETKSLESRLMALGDLPDLRTLFSRLSPTSSPIAPNLLKECFELQTECTSCPLRSELSLLKQNVAVTLVDVIFEPDKDGISWRNFLKGFEKCCQPAASVKLKLLLFYFYHLRKRAELPLTFSFKNEDSGVLHDAGLVGHLTSPQLKDFLWLCWVMGCDAHTCGHKDSPSELPNVEPLVKAAHLACSVSNSLMATDILPIEKLYKWMLLSVPGLPMSLFDYIRSRLHRSASVIQGQKAPIDIEGWHAPKSNMAQSAASVSHSDLLNSGVAWAIGLSQSDAIGYKLVSCSFGLQQDTACLLYRSSVHGKGMNRLWRHVEGYRETVLMLIQGITTQSMESYATEKSEKEMWLVGALVREGFENKSCYYGSRGCCIFALDPVMQSFRSTGNGSNFVYTHAHVVSSATYLQQQKRSDGIAFGGDIGKERLSLDEDFMHLTVRHHAMDKTYESGHLLPNQGYATIKGKVLDIEVWGFGGAATREKQSKFQERNNLFAEQNRKVDLQSFGNWADSPEKMMMDMISDPNKVQREER